MPLSGQRMILLFLYKFLSGINFQTAKEFPQSNCLEEIYKNIGA